MGIEGRNRGRIGVREEIVEAFNERVAILVESVSETKEKDGRKIEWKERKENYLANLEKASDDAVLIAVADKIDNIESKLEAFKKEGVIYLKSWKQPQEEYLWFHGEALRIAQARLPEHRLTKRFAEAHAREEEVFS